MHDDYADRGDQQRRQAREAEPAAHEHDWIDLTARSYAYRYVDQRCSGCQARRTLSLDIVGDSSEPEPTDPADWAQQQRDEAALEARDADHDES